MTGNNAIPFRLGFSGTGSDVKGWFFNGEDKEVSNSGSFEDGTLVLNFDSYASVLKASVKDGVLDGQYTQRGSHLLFMQYVQLRTQPPLRRARTSMESGSWKMFQVPKKMKRLGN
jgi:hypothetical protein